jgi:uncharacterized protein
MADQQTVWRSLSRDVCVRLLARSSVGRVVISVDALPSVYPVNFVTDGESILFRTSAGLVYKVAERGDIVAFEVDNICSTRPIGNDGQQPWAVTVVGPCRVIDMDEIGTFPLASACEPMDASSLVRVAAVMVSGWRAARSRRSRGVEQLLRPPVVHPGSIPFTEELLQPLRIGAARQTGAARLRLDRAKCQVFSLWQSQSTLGSAGQAGASEVGAGVAVGAAV